MNLKIVTNGKYYRVLEWKETGFLWWKKFEWVPWEDYIVYDGPIDFLNLDEVKDAIKEEYFNRYNSDVWYEVFSEEVEKPDKEGIDEFLDRVFNIK